MDVAKVLHMNAGVGEASYARNSFLQKKVFSVTDHVRKEAIRKMYENCLIPQRRSCLCIAELGCSSGPNALMVPCQVISVVHKIRRELGHGHQIEFQILLNDLPSNDFNTIFEYSIPSLGQEVEHKCFWNGVPGSFYNRLFQSESLHFVHSSYSLHWLSQVPEELTLGSSSPRDNVLEEQFRADFSRFLQCRWEEMVDGGCMVFTLPGRKDGDPFSHCSSAHAFNLVFKALYQMVSEGLIEEEKLSSFNIPVYMPSPTEIRSEIEKQVGSKFSLNSLHVSDVGWHHAAGDGEEGHVGMLGCMRAVTEPLLVAALGPGPELVDEVFTRYARLIQDTMAKHPCVWVNLSVSLTKRL